MSSLLASSSVEPDRAEPCHQFLLLGRKVVVWLEGHVIDSNGDKTIVSDLGHRCFYAPHFFNRVYPAFVLALASEGLLLGARDANWTPPAELWVLASVGCYMGRNADLASSR